MAQKKTSGQRRNTGGSGYYDDRVPPGYRDYGRQDYRYDGRDYRRYEGQGYGRDSYGREYYGQDYPPRRPSDPRRQYDPRRPSDPRSPGNRQQGNRSSGSRPQDPYRSGKPRNGQKPKGSGKNAGQYRSGQRSGKNAPPPRKGGKKGKNNDRNRKGGKRPVRVKKRFYFFVILLILLVAVGGYFGVKALVTHVVPSAMDKIHPSSGQEISDDANVKETSSGDHITDYDSVPMAEMILDDLGTEETKIKVIDTGEEEGEGSGEDGEKTETVTDENTIDLAKLPMPERIRAAVLSSWYISPLGQNRATIEESFGVLNKYEDWADGIYYHKGFPDSMYISYKGKIGSDGFPNDEAVCTAVSVALKQIIEFEDFEPGEAWGAIHRDEGDFGWTDQYYSILIQRGINLIVYCAPDGSVNQETHILVRQVR